MSNGYEEDYENEEPLLKELGINFDHIWMKIQVVLINRKIDEVCSPVPSPPPKTRQDKTRQDET